MLAELCYAGGRRIGMALYDEDFYLWTQEQAAAAVRWCEEDVEDERNRG